MKYLGGDTYKKYFQYIYIYIYTSYIYGNDTLFSIMSNFCRRKKNSLNCNTFNTESILRADRC